MSQINDIALVAQVVVTLKNRPGSFDYFGTKSTNRPSGRFFLHQTLGDTELSDDLAQVNF